VSEREGFPVADIDKLEYTQSEDGYLIYDAARARVHFLNSTAFFVLQSCDGRTACEAIAVSLQKAFKLTVAPLAEVEACLSTLREIGLVGGQNALPR